MALKVCFLGAVRRRTFICCRNIQISTWSAARDRNRSATIQTMSLTRSLITQQHRPILDQLLVRLSLRQGHATYTMVFWIPSLIKSWGVADLFHVGLLATWPQIAGIIGTILMGRHSDKRATMALRHLRGRRSNRPFGHTFSHAGVDHRPDARRPWVHFGDTAVLHHNHRIPFQGERRRRHRAYQQPRQSRPGRRTIRHGLYYATTGSSLYSTYLIVAAYLLSGLLLLKIVRAADPDET